MSTPRGKRARSAPPTADAPTADAPTAVAPAAAAPAASAPAAALSAAHDSPAARSAYASLFSSGAPFPHVHVRDVFPASLCERARAELLAELASGGGASPWEPKRNDLYAFTQRNLSPLGAAAPRAGSATAALVAALYAPAFRGWVSAVSGAAGLTATVDASAAVYARTQRLLCHDDDLATRRVAYILYLTPPPGRGGWSAARDGGALQLFDAHAGGCGQPGRVVAELEPAFNSLAFFEVGPASFHQVGVGEGGGQLRWLHAPCTTVWCVWLCAALGVG